MNRPMWILVVASACAGGCAQPAFEGSDRAAHAPGGSIRLDRMGRPEVQNFIIRDDRTDDGTPDVKALYNDEDVFSIGSSPNAPLYRAYLSAGLVALDLLDKSPEAPQGTPDWPLVEGSHPLADLLLDDYLIVDTSLACSVDTRSYLELERERFLLPGETPGINPTCGGRTPNDDVVDRMLGWMVSRGRTPIGDGVGATGGRHPASPTVLVEAHAAVDSFPYLAAPYADPAPAPAP